MTVRVRFAPSPTGYLHIGSARTALYNYVFAKANKGTFVLRIEDTDQERSTKEYEESQLKDLKWLGLDYDEGPEKPGKYGPYRQSERLDLYNKYANQLVDQNMAFHCFCTDEELEAKREAAAAAGKDLHYDGTCRNLSESEIKAKRDAGLQSVIRFKVPKKDYKLDDKAIGEINFPDGMIGDFVIIRSTGMPVYNFCCVIDDWLMEITHVIRGADHLNNTPRQLMIYEALGAKPPIFAHSSLLVGKDRQKLSKRHGATSVNMYMEENYLPQSLTNYLCLLGWSHPEEKDIFTVQDIENIFALNRFSKSPALYDIEKLNWVNEQHLRSLTDQEIVKGIQELLDDNHELFSQSEEWQSGFVQLFKEKVQFFKEFIPYFKDIFSGKIEETEDLKDIMSWETTPAIKDYLKGQIQELASSGKEFCSQDDFNSWSNYIKKELKIKGKPLFMGMRGVLTGQAHGSDLKQLIPLTPLKVLKERIG